MVCETLATGFNSSALRVPQYHNELWSWLYVLQSVLNGFNARGVHHIPSGLYLENLAQMQLAEQNWDRAARVAARDHDQRGALLLRGCVALRSIGLVVHELCVSQLKLCYKRLLFRSRFHYADSYVFWLVLHLRSKFRL